MSNFKVMSICLAGSNRHGHILNDKISSALDMQMKRNMYRICPSEPGCCMVNRIDPRRISII